MGSQTRIDPPEVCRVGGIFAGAASSVDNACAGLGECDFASGLGARYAHHELAYSAGLLAIAHSLRMLAQASRQFGDALVSAAEVLDAQDTANADSIVAVDVDRG